LRGADVGGMEMLPDIRPIEYLGDAVRYLDQTELPEREVWREARSAEEVAEAIVNMRVRGAPLLGIAAALGVAVEVYNHPGDPLGAAKRAERIIRGTRPTAVNLFVGLEEMVEFVRRNASLPEGELREALLREGRRHIERDIEINRKLGAIGAELVPDGAKILTHCNAGGLAMGGYGTALGVIYAAVERGKKVHVYADETRPQLQGARLTCWELKRAGIPCTLLPDGAAASLIASGRVDLAIVGADRIASNGDVANKVGTYMLAVLCDRHGVPFYVAAPLSTIDPKTPTGDEIPIEHRPPEEVTNFRGVRIAPEGVEVYNPAFDVTPAELVTAIITEAGVLRPPYRESIATALEGKAEGSPSGG